MGSLDITVDITDITIGGVHFVVLTYTATGGTPPYRFKIYVDFKLVSTTNKVITKFVKGKRVTAIVTDCCGKTAFNDLSLNSSVQ